MLPRRVLVVEDNKDAADGLAKLVRAWGYDTRVAYGGPQGLTLAFEFSPDVCLIDLGMPVLSGFELARFLRGDPRTAGILLAAVTGWSDEETRRKCREVGFDYHFTKPADIDELRNVLAGLGAHGQYPASSCGIRPIPTQVFSVERPDPRRSAVR